MERARTFSWGSAAGVHGGGNVVRARLVAGGEQGD